MPVTERFATAEGVLGRSSRWTQPRLVNLAVPTSGAASPTIPVVSFPLAASPAALSAPSDPWPPGGLLGAATANRVVGTGARPVAALLAARVLHGLGGIYSPAVTLQLAINSMAGANQQRYDIIANLDLSTLTVNTVDALTFLTVPADRRVSVGGTIVPTAIALYPGDCLFATIVAGGAFAPGSNLLMLEADIV